MGKIKINREKLRVAAEMRPVKDAEGLAYVKVKSGETAGEAADKTKHGKTDAATD